jgi:hypothetical protein
MLKKLLWLFEHDATGVAAALQAAIALWVAQYHLTSGQVAALDAVAVAVLALVAAVFTRPFHVQAVSGLIAALGTLMAAFSIHLPPGWVGIASAVWAVIVLLWRKRDVKTLAEAREAHKARAVHM